MVLDRRRFLAFSLAGVGSLAVVPRARAQLPGPFFATATTEYAAAFTTASNGDLWPSCWADDDELYAANGDGQGFGEEPMADIVVNRISGTPETGLSGQRLAAGDAICRVYADSARYNRKPTGMLAVDGNGDGRDELYLAVQDLRKSPSDKAFDDAPNATVVRSDDYGRTWHAPAQPMFSDHVFTTIMFLDFGRSQENARVLGPEDAGFAYAYGLDHNWRQSYSGTVPSPTALHLARVPRAAVQDRSAWRFYAGTGPDGAPRWSPAVEDRVPVLRDERRLYTDLIGQGRKNLTVISQGGVVYNAPLRRFIYTSWSEYTFEFYEAPTPWGPWRWFLSKDFGAQPWFGGPGRVHYEPTPSGHEVPKVDRAPQAAGCPGPKNGGYACTAPSKFVSADGTRMWLQSNWFLGVACGAPNYGFSVRRFDVAPRALGFAGAPTPPDNLARVPGAVVIEKSAHFGRGDYLNNGVRQESEDSFDGSRKPLDFWGYLWDRAYVVGRVVYTTGRMFTDGGWFAADLTVQVRQGGRWVPVAGQTVAPAYPYTASAGEHRSYTFTFEPVRADGVRIVGVPGGTATFTSIAELEVYSG
ncbi:hypothetical protein GCM10025787_41520 [Saccharopolyspora rosea]|uniref:DUF4185 domain-containing protein n=1 Tax=Saccharopolyspora rosea TaxID=524884 RepID=A0ABW3FJN9_9PSEU